MFVLFSFMISSDRCKGLTEFFILTERVLWQLLKLTSGRTLTTELDKILVSAFSPQTKNIFYFSSPDKIPESPSSSASSFSSSSTVLLLYSSLTRSMMGKTEKQLKGST